MYATVTANTPGVANPWRNRQKTSHSRLPAVAESIVVRLSTTADQTITLRRPNRSESTPANGAAIATPNVAAVTVKLTPALLAWKILANRGRMG